MTNPARIGRRAFIRTAAAGLAVVSAARPAHCADAAPTRKPNLIIILADDMGYGDLSCYGSTTISTPRIDALATHGLRFTDFHSNGAVCSPTRAALLTGRYQQRCGVEDVFRPQRRALSGLPLEEVTFAQMLKTVGYQTALFGKWHLGYPPEYNPVHRGFDTFRGFLSGNVDYQSHVDGSGEPDWWNGVDRAPESGYLTDLITAHGVDYIRQNKSRPFCLYLAHGAPHSPYQGRADSVLRPEGSQTSATRDSAIDATAYREMIQALDEGVGRVVDTIKNEGLERDTLILFCSDNGAIGPGSCGSLNGIKGQTLEGGHLVPAIAYWPGRIPPGETRETALTMDVFPTLAALSGASLPAGVKIDGINLLPLLLERTPLPPRTLFWRTGAAHREKAARKGPWKLREAADGVTLFNLDQDPGEKIDRAGDAPERLAELKAALAAWEKEVSGVPVRA